MTAEHPASTGRFYLTTPLYYVNARPHIGHSYTTVAADSLARFHRLKGEEVFFLTGTDEHGQKVEQAAAAAGLSPQEFVDRIVPHFTELWGKLDVVYDDFIRTTQERHTRAVQEALKILYDKGDIYQAEYAGWYCVPCETFWTEMQVAKLAEPKCPECQRDLEQIQENNYFFRLSKYQDWLVGYLKEHPGFIKPASRQNEALGFLENPLTDLCISRPRSRVGWGIPLPFSKEHVIYVWFDALLNYISAIGYLTDPEKFERFWPADVHLIGKDILRPHGVYWPIMLHALGLEPPRQVFAHGWWLMEDLKMSKSRGNIVDPLEVIDKYGVDSYRYFLLREVTFGMDGSFSETKFISRLNSDLANDLGNLVYRSLTMVEKYFQGVIPPAPSSVKSGQFAAAIQQQVRDLPGLFELRMEELNFNLALDQIWALINLANKHIEFSRPWEMSRRNQTDMLQAFIYQLCEVLRITAISILPFMPAAAAEISHQLGMEEELKKAKIDDLVWGLAKPGTRISKGKPLFPRIETSA